MKRNARLGIVTVTVLMALLVEPASLAIQLPGASASGPGPQVPSPVGRFSEVDARLVAAGLKDDLAGMKEALRLGGNPNAIDVDGVPALCWLMFAKRREGYAFLVENGGSGRLRIGARQLHATVYEEALVKNDIYWFTTLLAREPDLNLAVDESSGRTLLQYVVFYDRIELVERMLRAGADVNRTDKFGASPLLGSVTQGVHLKIALLLLKSGANSQCGTAKTGSFIDNLVRLGTTFTPEAKQSEAWRDYLSIIDYLAGNRVTLPDLLTKHLHEK